MKKFFLFAAAALVFAACSDKTTDEVAVQNEVTRAYINPTTNVCTLRGRDCKFYKELQNGSLPAEAINADGSLKDHYHCKSAKCALYLGYLLDVEDAVAHINDPAGHGGTGAYE